MADALTHAGLEVDAVHNHVFDISLTPNLSHAMSVLGVARELSALFKIPLFPFPDTTLKITESREKVTVTVQDPEAAPRYMARILENIQVSPSPTWLLQELELLGVRPINNVVDITNYVMHMIGQPLHAFDLGLIPSRHIIVRKAKNGEKLSLLDERTVTLQEDMLVIADDKGPLALAGVMGGSSTAVTTKTTSILLEAAHFSPSIVRKTAKKTATITESSKRFERGHDVNLCAKALDYAAFLMQSITGATVSPLLIDVAASSFSPLTIAVRVPRVNKLLGTSLSHNEIEEIYQRLGFTVSEANAEIMDVTVPTRRVDITSEIDLIEEVARIYGFNNIERKQPSFRLSSLGQSSFYTLTSQLREQALRLGLQELLTCDLLSPSECGDSSSLMSVMNASSREQSVLRPSLLPGLLKCLKHNLDHKEADLHGFEMGRVHYQVEGKFIEEEKLGLILHGQKAPSHGLQTSAEKVDFYDIKGLVSSILGKFPSPLFKASSLKDFHPFQQMEVWVKGEQVALFGRVHPHLTKKFDILSPVYFAEINITLLSQMGAANLSYKPLALYPGTERDLTITLKEETTLEELLGFLPPCDVLEKVSLVNIYRHKSLGDGLKNMSLRFYFRSPSKTLSYEEAEKEFARLNQALESLYATKN